MKHLPTSQFEIMCVIWAAKEAVTRSEIQQKLPCTKWKVTTINTFLTRLVQSGFLKIEHRGKEYVYSPLIEKDDYLSFEGKNILETVYDNSVRKFIASICGNHDLTEKDISELEELLSSYRMEKGKKGDDLCD